MKLVSQIKAHSVGIIGLLTAVLGFSYNTLQTGWIEKNATRRDAAFETMMALGALQEIVHYAHFVDGKFKDRKNFEAEGRGNPISGWSQVLLIRDMAFLVKPADVDAMSHLADVWQTHFMALDEPEAEQKISEAIIRSRKACVAVLESL